jgi:hypothetical protein
VTPTAHPRKRKINDQNDLMTILYTRDVAVARKSWMECEEATSAAIFASSGRVREKRRRKNAETAADGCSPHPTARLRTPRLSGLAFDRALWSYAPSLRAGSQLMHGRGAENAHLP